MKRIGFSTALAVSFGFLSQGLMAQGPPQIPDPDFVDHAHCRAAAQCVDKVYDGDINTFFGVNPADKPLWFIVEFPENTSVEEMELRFRANKVHEFDIYIGDSPDFDPEEDTPAWSFSYPTNQAFQTFEFDPPITERYMFFLPTDWVGKDNPDDATVTQLSNLAFFGYADLTSYPTTYGAPQTVVGETGVSPFVITNDADDPITINGLDTSGLHASFSLANLPTFPHQIPGNEELEFDVVFQPTEPGFFEGEMILDYTSAIGQVIVPIEVRGRGVHRALGYVPIRSSFASSQISDAYPPSNATTGRGMLDPDFVVGLSTPRHANLGNTNWLTDTEEVDGVENAFLEMDFEEDVQLDRMVIWNYNQGSPMWNQRGMKDVRIEYRALADGDWTTFANLTLTMTPTIEPYGPTDVIDLGGLTASRVRISSRGGLGVGNFFDPGETNPSAQSCGLAEVRFYSAVDPELVYDVTAYQFGTMTAPIRQSVDLDLSAFNGPITITSLDTDMAEIFTLGEVELPLEIPAGSTETLTLDVFAGVEDQGVYEGSVSFTATDGENVNVVYIPVEARIYTYAPGFVAGVTSSSDEVAIDAPQFYDAAHLTNDNGLTEVPETLLGSVDAVSIAGIPQQHWWSGNSGDFPYVIDFDLGKIVDVNDIAIWNFNRDPGWVARGTAEMNILYRASETDSWTTAHTAYELDQATGQNDDPKSNLIPMSAAEARYVRFEVLRSFADLDWVGMGKVRFYAEPYFGIDEVSIDLGSVSYGGSESTVLTITNNGKSDLEIEDAYFLNEMLHLTVTPAEELPVIVPPGETLELTVTLEETSKSTVVEEYEDEILRIVYTDVNRGSTDVLVSGSIEVEDTDVSDWLQF